jgi:hypothetical protein
MHRARRCTLEIVDAPDLADFDLVEIAEAVAAAKQKNNAYVRMELEKRAQALAERGEEKRARALALLAYVCRPPLVDVTTDDPFNVKINLPAVQQGEAAVLKLLAPQLAPVLRARLNDLIWAVTGDVRAALAAATDYLDGVTSGPPVEMFQLRQVGRGLFLLHRLRAASAASSCPRATRGLRHRLGRKAAGRLGRSRNELNATGQHQGGAAEILRVGGRCAGLCREGGSKQRLRGRAETVDGRSRVAPASE